MDVSNERMQILEMIESGRISAAQGLTLLQALSDSAAEDSDDELDTPGQAALPLDDVELPLPGASPLSGELPLPAGAGKEFFVIEPRRKSSDAPAPAAFTPAPAAGADESTPRSPEPAPLPPDAAKWKRWWTIPLWIGVVVMIWGALFMYWSLRAADGLSLWFGCASVPFIIGLMLMALAFQARSAPWLHLRVHQRPGESPQRIALSLPLPIGPASWFFRTFGANIKGIKGQNLDELLHAVGRNATPESPIYLKVDDEEDGKQVEIYIG